MHAETVLTPADLIWPLFVTEGDTEEPIASLPGVSRWSVKAIAERAREAAALGIPCLALFPNTPAGLRSDDGREALNPDNLMCRAIRAIKDAVPEIGVLTDVALDPYTSHGQDGVLNAEGYVQNDETTAILVRQALTQAEAGPSTPCRTNSMSSSDTSVEPGEPRTASSYSETRAAEPRERGWWMSGEAQLPPVPHPPRDVVSVGIVSVPSSVPSRPIVSRKSSPRGIR